MKTGELARWLDCSQSTIKNYTADFAAYLSAGAQGGGGARRTFSETDARIIAHAYLLRQQNATPDEIHAELQNLQPDNWRNLPPMPQSADPNAGPIELMPREAADTALATQRTALMREIAILSDRADDLQERLDSEISDHNDTRLQLLDTRERLGELRGQLAAVDHERRLWSWQRSLLLALASLAALALLLATLALLAR